MSIELHFTCGHTLSLAPNQATEPQCVDCGCKQIAHVKAPAPRFTGACTGPCVVDKKD